jgi:hypothetical protein
MEEQLRRTVVVTITGTRPQVDLADAEALLHSAFQLGPADMSIRAYSTEDFLVLCADVRVRDTMVAQGLVHAPRFSLSLRQAVALPFLVPVELTGVLGHAWNRRTAEVLLDGFGYVVDVATPTARRDDMSVFKVWVRTLDRTVCRRQGCYLWRSRQCLRGLVGGIEVLPGIRGRVR